jgi:hypothetical protein
VRGRGRGEGRGERKGERNGDEGWWLGRNRRLPCAMAWTHVLTARFAVVDMVLPHVIAHGLLPSWWASHAAMAQAKQPRRHSGQEQQPKRPKRRRR